LKNLSDIDIISKILQGNADLFRLLVERYKEPVAAVIKNMLGDCPEAEDVGQETFIRMYQSLAGFRGDASLKTYLIRIAMNLSLNEIKRIKKRNSRDLHIDSGIQLKNIVESSEIERAEIMEIIQKALNRLEIRQRSVFVLRIIEGFSTKETSEILKIPVGTVLSRLSRAVEEMKKNVVL